MTRIAPVDEALPASVNVETNDREHGAGKAKRLKVRHIADQGSSHSGADTDSAPGRGSGTRASAGVSACARRCSASCTSCTSTAARLRECEAASGHKDDD